MKTLQISRQQVAEINERQPLAFREISPERLERRLRGCKDAGDFREAFPMNAEMQALTTDVSSSAPIEVVA